MANYQSIEHDVLVIGAGGAGIRAAIEAAEMGANVGLICKSLLGKAHTVMAEGGMAAALGNVESRDNWKVHFRDTMRGGKMLNNWRMAQLHAQEAPDRANELESYGAVFDRTPDGRILQRNFGGHLYPRLAHVGDRTGLEMIRTLQDKAVHTPGLQVHMECTIYKLLVNDGRVCGAVGYWRQTGEFVVYKAKAVVLATGGIGKSFKVTSNSWEYTGDGHAMAYLAGADLIDMEFIQFHPTGMMWPLSVKGILVTEGVRGEGGVLRNNKGERFMFKYVPEQFKKDYADTEDEARRWLDGDKTARRPPELLTRDVVARAINAEVKAGRGSPHGGAFLDIAAARSPDYIKRKLPSMYHQFKELAQVDITKDAMEVGPTTHYIMGGVRVHPETAESTVPGIFAAGEAAGGMHGANRLGGNSLSDLLVFGRRAGMGAANYAKNLKSAPALSQADVDATLKEMTAPLDRVDGENPYTIAQDLQELMQTHIGIIREEKEMQEGLEKLLKLKERASRVASNGTRAYNPGWNQALDLRAMLTCSEAIARAAIERKESRGGHTRNDYPDYDKELSKVNFLIKKTSSGEMGIRKEPLPQMPAELQELFKGESNATSQS
ncbi:MAG: fumarate reductase/succinate dehydrogenase flavoprotein subunit [Deltaproteobacteria bacterium]|nr:fumarate reductase/succinate dehydrogenase flavoprotein subunit [Deltaproteobacteria bacterium]